MRYELVEHPGQPTTFAATIFTGGGQGGASVRLQYGGQRRYGAHMPSSATGAIAPSPTKVTTRPDSPIRPALRQPIIRLSKSATAAGGDHNASGRP
jgi:hypothetical protein